MQRIRPIEIMLGEVVVYLLIWIANDYMAAMLSLIFGSIFLIILLTSLIVELVEKSKVPRWYYTFMGLSVLAPIMAGILYSLINKGMEWL